MSGKLYIDLTGNYQELFEKREHKSLFRKILDNKLFYLLLVLNISLILFANLSFSVIEEQKTEIQTLKEDINEKEEELDFTSRLLQKNISFHENKQEPDFLAISMAINEVLSTSSGQNRVFLKKSIPEAIRVHMRYGIPVSTLLSQAIYESRYGRSSLAKKAHNYHGLKALSKDWKGKKIYMKTKDFNKKVTHVQPFRKYKSLYDGFVGYAEFLKSYKRYRYAFNYTNDGEKFLKAIWRAGYCPDKDYYYQVKKIMTRHKLDKFEQKILKIL